MLIQLDRASPHPLYLQISQQLQQLIVSGALPPGHRLPPERSLAITLGVNRTTILAAYRELKAEGFVSAHVGQGTVVEASSTHIDQGSMSAMTPTRIEQESTMGASFEHSTPGTAKQVFSEHNRPGTAKQVSSASLAFRPLFSQEALRTQDSLTRDILALAGRPDVISFAAGIPIPDLEPLPEITSLMAELLETQGHALLHHTPTEGLPALRESLSRHLPVRGIHAAPQDLLILSGAQQGLDLLARVLLDPGDTVLVEEPTFFCARQIFEGRGARVIGLPCDTDGPIPDQLEAWLSRVHPKFLYVMPTFHNPTGRTMSLERRRRLLDIASGHNLPIIEDDAYNGLRYEGRDLPPLKALDTRDLVIYLGSFSKLLFMGLRVGWMQGPRELLRQVAIHRQLSDLHSASMSQWMVDACLRNGLLERHRQRTITENRKRRDCMLHAMQRHLPSDMDLRWTPPEGGLYIWLTLPAGLSPQRVQAAAIQRGVAYVPGQVFSLDGSSAFSLRLNFTFVTPERIEEGIRLLGLAIHDAAAERGTYGRNAFHPAEALPIL